MSELIAIALLCQVGGHASWNNKTMQDALSIHKDCQKALAACLLDKSKKLKSKTPNAELLLECVAER